MPRLKLLSELREITGKIALVKDGWSDPVAVLMRSTRADPHRATYAANLANSGPVEIKNALRDAVLTGDCALAAAAFGRLDSFDKSARAHVTYSKKDVAESLVSEEWAKARQFIAISEIAENEAEIADDEATGKKIASTRKIGLGIKKRDLAKVLGVDALVSGEGAADSKGGMPDETFEEMLDRKYPGV